MILAIRILDSAMPSSRVTLRTLRSFVSVYEEQSFSAAAQRENATQSGMSTQVKSLEEAVGSRLLDRRPGALDLTPAGRIVYDEGVRILGDVARLEMRVAELGRAVTGRIRLGLIPGLTRAVFPEVMGAFNTAYPNVDVSLVEAYSFLLMRNVLEGDLDLAVVPAGDTLPGLKSTWLGSDREMLVTAPGRLDKPQLAPVTAAEIAGLPLIVPSGLNVRRGRIDEYLASHGVGPGRVMELDAMLATLEYIGKSEWCAILPSALMHPDRDGRDRALYPLTGPGMTTDYMVVERSAEALPQAAGFFVEHLKSGLDRILADWPDL